MCACKSGYLDYDQKCRDCKPGYDVIATIEHTFACMHSECVHEYLECNGGGHCVASNDSNKCECNNFYQGNKCERCAAGAT